MKRKQILFAVATILVLFVGHAAAQARPNLMLSRVVYNTMKTMAKPLGERKEKIDALDKEIAEAFRLGRTGEVRRLLAKGRNLLLGREWTDELDYSNSLVLRAEEVIVDSGRPYAVHLGQIYAPRLVLSASLSAKVSLHKPVRGILDVQAGEKVKDLAVQDGVSHDLLDDPCRIELEFSGVDDGTYLIQAVLSQGEKPIGSAKLSVELRRGLLDRLRAVESGLASVQGFDDLKADVLYPLDRIRNVNRGRLEGGGFQVEAELKAAEEILASLKQGKDPFAGRTGDLERHYILEGAGEIMPYRVYVPGTYDGAKPYPLIIALHGLGGNEDSFFDDYGKEFPKLAEARGYLVAAPLGFRVDGGYGMSNFRGSNDAAGQRKGDLSEKDVMTVLARMKSHYKVDESRIYLTGHSMGAIGTWYLGARYPGIWTALAPFAGMGDPTSLAKITSIPEIVVHGDADPTVPVAGSRAMVAEMKKLGIEHRYIEVPGGNHMNIVQPNFAAVFDFFDAHRKTAR